MSIILSTLDINRPNHSNFYDLPRSQKGWQSAPRRDRRNTSQSMRQHQYQQYQQQQQPPRPASSLGFSAQTGIDLGGMSGPVYQRTSRFDPFEDMSITTPSSYTHYYYYDHTTNKPTLAFADPPRHAHALDTSSFPAPAQGLAQSQSCNTTFANSNFNTPNNLINRNFIPSSRSPSPPSPTSFYPSSLPGTARNRSPSPPNQNPGPRHHHQNLNRSPSPPSPTGTASRPGHVRRRSGAMSMSLGVGAGSDVITPAPVQSQSQIQSQIQAPAPNPTPKPKGKAAVLVSQGPLPLERAQSAPPTPTPASKPSTTTPTPSASTTPQRSIHSILSRPLPASSRDTIAGIVASMLLSRADTPSVRSRSGSLGRCGAAGAGYVKSGLSRVVFVE